MGVDAEMFVRTKYRPTEQDLEEWHYRLGCAFHENLWAFGTHDNRVPEERYLFIVPTWEQDGDEITPEPGEVFLKLRPMSRYYGPGYERGNFPLLKGLAEFLEILIPGGEVWYGGDSSGICASRFGPKEREEMLRYFVEHTHMPYLGGPSMMPGARQERPTCPYCKRYCPQFGFGGKYASFSCLGCGWQRIERDGKVQQGWNLEKR